MASDDTRDSRRSRPASNEPDEYEVPDLNEPVAESRPQADLTEHDAEEYLIFNLEAPAQPVSQWRDAAEFVRDASPAFTTMVQRCLYALVAVGIIVMGVEDKMNGNQVIAALIIVIVAGGGKELLCSPPVRNLLKRLLELGTSDEKSDNDQDF